MLFDEQIQLPDGSKLSYYPNFLNGESADSLYQSLLTKTEWQQNSIHLFGKDILEPRLSQFVGETGLQYRYSKSLRHTEAWPKQLITVLENIQHLSGYAFNCALLNYYRNGDDSMGWHSDDEPELGKEPVIASLSLGASRDFLMRPVSGNKKTTSISLTHGSLLVMHAGVQENWQHAVAKHKGISSGRINITFRQILY